jgi:esterase/lipase
MKELGIYVLVALIGLLLGGLVGSQFSETIEVPVEKIVNQVVTQNVSVPVEVIKEVEVNYLDNALNAYLDEVNEDLDKYQEISKIETEDAYSVEFDLDRKDNPVIKVTFEVSYRITDTLTDDRTSVSEKVEVVFKQDKEPKITIL